jgi:hypothetical protein
MVVDPHGLSCAAGFDQSSELHGVGPQCSARISGVANLVQIQMGSNICRIDHCQRSPLLERISKSDTKSGNLARQAEICSRRLPEESFARRFRRGRRIARPSKTSGSGNGLAPGTFTYVVSQILLPTPVLVFSIIHRAVRRVSWS